MIDQPESTYRPLSTKDWMVTLLLSFIPLVNLIMYFVWAFSDDTHPSKKNWAKAALIWILIAIVFYVLIFALFGGMLLSLANSQNF